MLTPTFGNFANNIAKAFQGEDRTAIENAYVKNNFEWYKARDKFDAYLLVSFTYGKTGMGRTGDDIIKMKEAGHLGSFASISAQARRHPREVFAQILNNKGV